MKKMYSTLAAQSRIIRWGAGVTVAGFVAGGAFAAVAASNDGTPASGTAASAAPAAGQSNLASASSAELSTLLSAANATTRPRRAALARLRGIGGYYGSLTVKTKAGVRTVAFERGTIESVTGSNVVVKAPDGVLMTWLLVSDTVVRDHGKASTKSLSDGQRVFVGGPVASGAKDARLIVVRTGVPANKPASPSSVPLS
ncbi:MAG TPA: hypothetical protein VFB06_12140 [Streptosporangiaceae bacterium]|nr:hypothetical protein [Streptosporangiaceae bacterium]